MGLPPPAARPGPARPSSGPRKAGGRRGRSLPPRGREARAAPQGSRAQRPAMPPADAPSSGPGGSRGVCRRLGRSSIGRKGIAAAGLQTAGLPTPLKHLRAALWGRVGPMCSTPGHTGARAIRWRQKKSHGQRQEKEARSLLCNVHRTKCLPSIQRTLVLKEGASPALHRRAPQRLAKAEQGIIHSESPRRGGNQRGGMRHSRWWSQSS